MIPFGIRKGFALLEILIVTMMLVIIGLFTMPILLNYKYRNDLGVAMSQTRQGLLLAQQYSMALKNNSEWGLQIPNGEVFSGTGYTYAIRDPVTFESLVVRRPLPTTVSFSGAFTEVSFDPSGTPSRQGRIMFIARSGESDSIVLGYPIRIIATSSASSTSSSSAGSSASAGGSSSSSPTSSSSSVASSSSSAGASSSSSSAAASCGNSNCEGANFEQCDDGNTNPGDGCSPTCQIEASCTCGACFNNNIRTNCSCN